MTAPALASYVNGIGQVSADNYNTFLQTCDIAAQLRGFAGVPGIEVYMRGFLTIGDGGQGIFYWNAGGTAADDGGVTTIVPSSSTAGVWTRLSSVLIKPYSIQIPITGFSITIPNGKNLLILNPVATLATGTVIMPAIAFDGQPVTISTEQAITTFTVSGNAGQSVVGAPATLAQYSSITFVYDLSNLTWYFEDSGGGGGGGGSTTANALASLTTTVNVSNATAPTAGQVLTATSDSAATWQNPAAGGSGALILLSTQTANSSASIAFNSTFLTSTYTHYMIIYSGVYSSINASNLLLTTSTNNGSSYIASGYIWAGTFQNPGASVVSATGANPDVATNLTLTSGVVTNSANTPASGTINVFDISSPTPTYMMQFNAFGVLINGGGALPPGTINNIKIAPGSGVFTGTFKLYGVA